MMTTLAMIFGMLPLALGIGAGAEMRAPMARAVVGGLIVGVTQTLAGQYIAFFDGFELASAFLLILVVLLVRPQGLFGTKVVTRV